MQMNKAILRNSKIVIFDQKKIAAIQVSFFPNLLDWKQIFFHVGHIYAFQGWLTMWFQ